MFAKKNMARTLGACLATAALVATSITPATAAEDSADSAMVQVPIENSIGTSISQLMSSMSDQVPNWSTCLVSTYGIGDGLLGSGCANGSKVTSTSLGVAHKTLPFGTKVKFAYKGKTVTATVVDRGPYVSGREFDLQPAVAHALGVDGLAHLSYAIVD